MRIGLQRWGTLLGVCAASWLVFGGSPVALAANGGTLRLNDVPVGPYRMAVFTDPSPMRPGAVDVSVLILDPDSGEVVRGLSVSVEATDGINRVSSLATPEQADDPDRYYSAKFTLPAPGTWTFEVRVMGEEDNLGSFTSQDSFEVRVRAAGVFSNPMVLTALWLLPLAGLAFWMLRGAGARPAQTAALLAVFAVGGLSSCVPPDRTPPYADLAQIFAVEDARHSTVPQELVDATRVQNSAVRGAAYRALGRHERVAWMETIAQGMRDPDPEVRVAAINAVTQSAFQDDEALTGSREAIRLFVAALGGERHPRVRAAIALEAGRLGRDSTLAETAERIILEVSTEPGEAALFDPRSLGNPGAPLLDLVRGSFALARASGGSHPRRDELTILLAELTGFGRRGAPGADLDPNEPTLTAVRIRRTALATLLATSRLSRPVVVEASRDSDAGVRAVLAAALARGADVPAGEEVMDTFAADDAAWVRTAWVRGYGRSERADGCQPLIAAAGDLSSQVRLAALDALGGDCPVEEEVERLALLRATAGALDSASSWHAPAHATATLARLGAADALGLTDLLASHSNPFARAWAARAYGSLGNVEGLGRLATDPVANVQTAAIAAMPQPLDARTRPIVMDRLEGSEPQLVMTAAGLLAGAPVTTTLAEAVWSTFSRFTSAGRETDRDVRMALLDRIEELNSAPDSTRLLPVLEDYDSAVANRAAGILSVWLGRVVTATPRPFSPDPLPSAEELERLDGAIVQLGMESGGTIQIELLPLVAPTNAARFARLADSGALNGLTFHRVVPGFVIQGGSPGANEYAGHGAYSRDEVSDRAHWRGTVGLSTRGRDTGDGQIFVNLLDNLRLDNNYTIFGRVVAGMDVVDGVLEGEQIATAVLMSAVAHAAGSGSK